MCATSDDVPTSDREPQLTCSTHHARHLQASCDAAMHAGACGRRTGRNARGLRLAQQGWQTALHTRGHVRPATDGSVAVYLGAGRAQAAGQQHGFSGVVVSPPLPTCPVHTHTAQSPALQAAGLGKHPPVQAGSRARLVAGPGPPLQQHRPPPPGPTPRPTPVCPCTCPAPRTRAAASLLGRPCEALEARRRACPPLIGLLMRLGAGLGVAPLTRGLRGGQGERMDAGMHGMPRSVSVAGRGQQSAGRAAA